MGKKAVVSLTVCVMVIVVVFLEFLVFKAPVPQSTKDYYTEYYKEFNKTPTPAYNYSFSPPVSMYHALLIALESGGWNAPSLKNMTISVELDYCAFLKSPNKTSGFELLYPVTHSVADWSPKQVNETTYRYAWTIIVHHSSGAQSIPPPGYYWVDAATAELVSIRL